MTKTQRRRAARQRAVDAAGAFAGMPQDYKAAVRLLDDDVQWRHLNDTLCGSLALEFTSPFIDTETWCPEHAHLVVHLDLLRDPGDTTAPDSTLSPYEQSVPDLQRRATQALEAIATLCIISEYLSRDADLYSRFWRRVVESAMLETPLDPSAADTWTRFTMARGIPLLVSWSRKQFEPGQLFEPLREFLATPRPTTCETINIPATFGLRFVRAALTTAVLAELHELLVMPSESMESLLVDPTRVDVVWFDSIDLYSAELSVVAAMLADPKLRRVDGLNIDTLDIEHLGEMEPGFADALSSVFTNLVASNSTDQSSSQVPLSLSLPYASFDAERLDALRQTIASGSRPLASLALANIRLRTDDAFRSLATLLFTPLPNLTPAATLDVSMLENRLMTGLGLLARDTVEALWTTGGIREGRVECVVNGGPLYHRPHGKKMDASPLLSTFYTIEDFHPATRHIKITVSANGGATSVSGWVLSSTVTQLRCDGLDRIGSSFTRLIFDPTYYDRTSSRTILHLTSALGSQLKGLALRNYSRIENRLSAMATSLPHIFSRCPRLEELSLVGSQLAIDNSPVFWTDPACELPRSLSILSLGHCGLRDVCLEALQALPLRYLSLPGNPIGSAGVESLLALLQTQPSLVSVELTPQASHPPAFCEELRSQINAMVDHDYLSARGKAAVLSALLDIQQRNPHLPYPGNDVVASVCAFVGTKPCRVVKWVHP